MSTVRKVPLRKCIGCNEMKNKKEMIRVVKTTEGTIVPDTTGRMNGRGAYVCSLECLGESGGGHRTFPFSEGRNSIRGL